MPKEAVYTTDDHNRWNSILPVQQSVFGNVEFARIVEKCLGHQAKLYVLQDGTSRIAYPFFVRSIESSLAGELDSCLSDIASPEFTGPLASGDASAPLAAEFLERFTTFALHHGIVTEFIHLHPWKAFTGALVGDCLHFNRNIVYVDLTWPKERLWRESFSHACRKNINRSQRENVRVFEAKTLADIREFHRVYTDTMTGRNALEQYFLPLDYFAAIFDQMQASARFVLAEYRDQVIAGTLYLHDADDIFSYLGGADVNFQNVRPTNAVIYDTIQWGQQEGKKRLILGGGYTPNDGILRFKASFSPARAQFFVYKRVHREDRFAALCRAWSSTYGEHADTTTYFPPYRFLPAEIRPVSNDDERAIAEQA